MINTVGCEKEGVFLCQERLPNQFKRAIQMFRNHNFVSIRFQENFPPYQQTDQNTSGNCRVLCDNAAIFEV